MVTVKLLESIGVNYTINYIRQLGITSQLTPTLSLALGASGVTPWELLTAYSTFAGQGAKVEPYLIERVLDRNGTVIEEHQVKNEPVISPQTAYLVTDLLQGVVQEGTGARAKRSGDPRRARPAPRTNSRTHGSSAIPPRSGPGCGSAMTDHTVSLGKGEPAAAPPARSGSIS